MDNHHYWNRTDTDTEAVRDRALSAFLRCARCRVPYPEIIATVAGAVSPFVPNDVELSVKLKQDHTWFDSDGSGRVHTTQSVLDRRWYLTVSLTEMKGRHPFNLYVFSYPLPTDDPWWSV